jgi:hypothetical protein
MVVKFYGGGQMFKTFAGFSGLMIAAAVVAAGSTASSKPTLKVVNGAMPLTTQEKASVSGKCGCTPPPAPTPSKPGYGFGTTGHYGPPGQGFTPSDNWRNHAAGDGLTPTGRDLPPTAFKPGSGS